MQSKIVDYLDITLKLNDGKCGPFHKANNEKTYIHVQPSHPPQIIKKIPRSTEKDYPAYFQQGKYLKIRKVTMSSL